MTCPFIVSSATSHVSPAAKPNRLAFFRNSLHPSSWLFVCDGSRRSLVGFLVTRHLWRRSLCFLYTVQMTWFTPQSMSTVMTHSKHTCPVFMTQQGHLSNIHDESWVLLTLTVQSPGISIKESPAIWWVTIQYHSHWSSWP